MSRTEGCHLSRHCGNVLEKTKTRGRRMCAQCVSLRTSREAKTSLMNSKWLWKVNKQTPAAAASGYSQTNRSAASLKMPDGVGAQSWMGGRGVMSCDRWRRQKHVERTQEEGRKRRAATEVGLKDQYLRTRPEMDINLECGWFRDCLSQQSNR